MYCSEYLKERKEAIDFWEEVRVNSILANFFMTILDYDKVYLSESFFRAFFQEVFKVIEFEENCEIIKLKAVRAGVILEVELLEITKYTELLYLVKKISSKKFEYNVDESKGKDRETILHVESEKRVN